MACYLLSEDGSPLLTEDGGHLLLESSNCASITLAGLLLTAAAGTPTTAFGISTSGTNTPVLPGEMPTPYVVLPPASGQYHTRPRSRFIKEL